jgi:Holliday junction DNA helicase RuvB
MARKRIVSTQVQSPEDEASALKLRPQRLEDFIGQRELIEKLSIALEAAKQRGEPMEHVLLHGPPGLGKTTLAHVIAAEMGSQVLVTSGPALTKGADLIGTLTKMQPRDVLFIDEIHRMPATVEEFLYRAMEEFRIDFKLDTGMSGRILTYQLKPFTLIGATTRAGNLSGPLRSRFGLLDHVRFYELDELATILSRGAERLNMLGVPGEAIEAIAKRSRGTPRVALRLLRRVRDFAQVRAAGRLDLDVIDEALKLEGVDSLGLDELDRTYLRTVQETYDGGPVGLEAVAASMGEDAGTLQDVVEPYLLQIGFLARTRLGRQLTESALRYLGASNALRKRKGGRSGLAQDMADEADSALFQP